MEDASDAWRDQDSAPLPFSDDWDPWEDWSDWDLADHAPPDSGTSALP